MLVVNETTTFLELAHAASGQCYDVLRRRTRSRFRSNASTGQSIGSVFLSWDMHSPLFNFFYDRHINWTNSMSI